MTLGGLWGHAVRVKHTTPPGLPRPAPTPLCHSTALRANDMWTNTIGMDANPQSGSNAAIEASIYAPTFGGGGNRAQRREAAQQLIQASKFLCMRACLGFACSHVAACCYGICLSVCIHMCACN
jgi:hypothetical protein